MADVKKKARQKIAGRPLALAGFPDADVVELVIGLRAIVGGDVFDMDATVYVRRDGEFDGREQEIAERLEPELEALKAKVSAISGKQFITQGRLSGRMAGPDDTRVSPSIRSSGNA